MTYEDQQLETRLRALTLPGLSHSAGSRLLAELDAMSAAVPLTRIPVNRAQTRRPALALAVTGAVLVLGAAVLLAPRVLEDNSGDRSQPQAASPGTELVAKEKPPGKLLARRKTLIPGPRLLREKSLAQSVNEASVIVVGRALKSAPAPVRPGSPREYLISFRLKRVLKGKFVEKVFSTQTPTAPDEFIGKDWVVMLSPAYIARRHRYGGTYHIKLEPRVKEILSGNR